MRTVCRGAAAAAAPQQAPLEAALEAPVEAAAAAAARRGAGLARRLLAVALGGAARPLRLSPLPPG